MYGGAAGGGKSDALLRDALKYVEVPGYSALILRRTYADLDKPDALIPRSKSWLFHKGAMWSETKHQWTFPSGATLSFGHIEHVNDVYNYQGAAYQYIGFDELTQFVLFMYTYMFSRCRRPTNIHPNSLLAEVPLRVRAASNPGGIGHDWVKDRFAIDNKGGHNPDRPFIPALKEDNPGLDQSTYDEMLDELDLVTRAQLKLGDWDIGAAGNVFKREWFQRYRVVPRDCDRGGIFIDTAQDDEIGEDYSAIATWRARGWDLYVEDVINERLAWPDLIRVVVDAKNASRLTEDDPGLPVYIEETAWAVPLIKILRQQIGGVIGVKPGGHSKVARAMAASPTAEGRNIYLPEGAPWVAGWIEQHVGFPRLGANGKPIGHDDMVDTTSLAVGKLSLPVRHGARRTEVTYAPKAPDVSRGTPNTYEAVRAVQAKRRAQKSKQRRGGI